MKDQSNESIQSIQFFFFILHLFPMSFSELDTSSSGISRHSAGLRLRSQLSADAKLLSSSSSASGPPSADQPIKLSTKLDLIVYSILFLVLIVVLYAEYNFNLPLWLWNLFVSFVDPGLQSHPTVDRFPWLPSSLQQD